jgi:hypothetical protein
VVLPAGTDVDLPFSINAPFLQDPARQKIKEPELTTAMGVLIKQIVLTETETMRKNVEEIKEHVV